MYFCDACMHVHASAAREMQKMGAATASCSRFDPAALQQAFDDRNCTAVQTTHTVLQPALRILPEEALGFSASACCMHQRPSPFQILNQPVILVTAHTKVLIVGQINHVHWANIGRVPKGAAGATPICINPCRVPCQVGLKLGIVSNACFVGGSKLGL